MEYKVVVQVVLLYGSEIWVATDAMMTLLEGFHHRIAIHVLGMTLNKFDSGEWDWDLVDAELETTGSIQ